VTTAPSSRRRASPPPVHVYKLGGPALEDASLLGPLAEDLRRCGGRVALVHGGGLRVERWLRALGIESRFVGGRRATSLEAMEVVERELSGGVNKALASELTRAGVPAIGISGRDGGLLEAEPLPELGRVGTRVRVRPEPVLALWRAGFVPVVSPVSAGPDGGPLNVNADEAALGLARALSARSLVYLSDVDGIRGRDGLFGALSADAAAALVADGTIAGGMTLKVAVALEAARSGVPEVVIAGRARLAGGFPGTRLLAAAPAEARA
jgi:acetylglutamate kinase